MAVLPGWFRWQQLLLPYVDHPYNNTRNNERAVELAVARAWLQDVRGQGLEVGHVLGHYPLRWPGRRVVDLTERAPGVENMDVLDVDGQYPWIISISTIEHVGMAEYGAEPKPMAATNAVLHLVDLLAPGGRMLVTVPFGHNPDLDTDVAMGALDVAEQWTFHRRQRAGQQPTWRQQVEPVAPRPYNRQAASADALWIGEWHA